MCVGYIASSEGSGAVISCHTVDEWKKIFQDGSDSKKLVVVDFTASWRGPCRFIAPVLGELAKKLHDVIFLKVDVDELKIIFFLVFASLLCRMWRCYMMIGSFSNKKKGKKSITGLANWYLIWPVIIIE